MKKLKKMLSGILATVMSVSMLGAVPVSAAETEGKLYTLDELFAMTDEEFFRS